MEVGRNVVREGIWVGIWKGVGVGVGVIEECYFKIGCKGTKNIWNMQIS